MTKWLTLEEWCRHGGQGQSGLPWRNGVGLEDNDKVSYPGGMV